MTTFWRTTGIVVQDAWFDDDILAGRFATDLLDVFQAESAISVPWS
jgi:hypothetical protein